MQNDRVQRELRGGWIERRGFALPARVSAFLPVLSVLVALILLGYPLALSFGLPLALRDMRDLRKWEKATVTSQPPQQLSGKTTLTFADSPEAGVLVRDGAPLAVPYTQTDNTVTFQEPTVPLITWGEALTPVSETLYEYGGDLPDPLTLYVGDALAVGGAIPASETPDDVRTDFTFSDATGPILLDDEVLTEGTDYTVQGGIVTFPEAPPFGGDLRRVSGDYAVLDEGDGTIIFTAPPSGVVRAAESVVHLAERLSGETDGTNQRFTLTQTPVVETEPYDIYVDSTPLSSDDERPEERVDGEQATFTFESAEGIVTVDDAPQLEGENYTRSGSAVTFARPPERNAQLRQYPGAFLTDADAGEVLLAVAPPAGATVWTDHYTVYAQPGCGANVMACFLALPQHPVPFPHWIAARVAPFFNKFPLSDERNIVRAVLYTAAGTIAALGLGAAVGTLLAVLFVMVRPLERALLPWLVASQTVPIIALVPVLLLILGNAGITIQTSLLPTALIGATIAFFPVVVGTVKGLRSVDPLALDLMKSYAATRTQVFAKVRFPAAVPFLFTSLKLAAAAALVGALVAETESNNRRGLGFQILGQVQSGNVADVWILLLISALLGIGLVALVGLLQRFIAPWERL
jgi:NitT/TauT family transport system permease protein